MSIKDDLLRALNERPGRRRKLYVKRRGNLRRFRPKDKASMTHIEPVCGTPKRKSENGEQRLAPEKHHSETERLEIADQRLGRASLTRRNVGGSHTPGNHTAETALPGWGRRIRTCKCHFGKCPLKCRADF